MKYKLIIFDFDGTIADTSLGIIDSHKYALVAMGKSIPQDEMLRKVIGGNLLKTYIETFGFQEDDARKAVGIYRKRYAENGIHKATVYSGFEELLKELKSCGYKIGVATLKAEKFAKVMLKELNIDRYFDIVSGMDENDTLDKAGLLLRCCECCNIDVDDAVLIGDSINDLNGANQAGVNFIGVTYGFGFKPDEKYEFISIDYPKQLLAILK